MTSAQNFVVTTASDVIDAGDGALSLREAIAAASSGSTISFDASLSGATITLTLGQLTVSDGVRISGDIDGDGAADITIDAANASRVIEIASGTVTLQSLNIQGGAEEYGAGILVQEFSTLNLINSVVRNNNALGEGASGGGIANNGTANLTNVTITGNRADTFGGGVLNANEATFTNVVISENIALTSGGGFYAFTSATFLQSTITNNVGAGSVGGVGTLFGNTFLAPITLIDSIVLGNLTNSGTTNNIDGSIIASNSITSGNLTDVFALTGGLVGGGVLADEGGAVPTVPLQDGITVGAMPSAGPTNEAPVITSPASAAVAENTLATGITPAATDADGDTVTFALSGTDAALFEIVAGEIRFIAAPDFEAPGDAGADNTYELVLEASDGTDTTTQDLSIDVTDIRDTNEAPVITSPASAAVAENTLATGITPAATDADGDTVTFALSGTDAALFEIVAGEIRFIAAPDFEAPGDAGADNTYELVLEASDGTDTTTQDLSIDVTDIRDTNEAPVITSPASASLAENTLATGITPAATDADGDTVTFALSGTDAALFEIVAGEIRFIAAPDFEAPGDAGADNTYELVLEASDGTDTTTQDLSIDVTDIRDTNEAPVITSPASASLAENTLATGITPAATDADGDTVTFALSGTDAALFEIVAGEIRFIAAPDFEAPGDAGADNTYELVLEASDGTDTTTQDLSIDVTDIRDTNEAPVITSPASAAVAENTLATGITPAATDADGDTVTFALSGTDAALFEIVAGEIRFIAAPDFEAPGDAGADNTYELVLEASDGTDTTTQDLSIDVTDIRDTNEAPVITSPASASLAENTLATGITPAATDADGDTVTFALSGTDAALFEIVAGEIRFIAAPDFEAPGDAGADNTYELVLEASDGTDTTTQDLSIDVTDIRDTNEAPVITSPASAAVAENTLATGITPAATDADGDTVTFALSGTDAALFEIVAGEIRFIAAPDFEAPGDAGADNTYELVLEASDGTDTTTQDLSIDVTDIRDTNEAPVITSPASAAVAENTLATGITPAATDADGDTVTFALSGTDAALFEIVAGEIRFIAAPDFEAPGDAGADNTYELVLEASDGTDTTTQDLSIDVTDIRDTNEAPVITSPASASLAENTLATGITPAATDADGDTVTFALSGTDAALFEIVAGEIRFIAAPDFEAPGDAGADNTYELVLEASDGTDTTTQDLSIDVTDIRDTNEAPVITSPASASLAENTLATGITPAATDADGDTVTFALSGTDAALFEIVAGEIRFIAAPDFEAPGDAGADNTYELVLEASDGTDTTTQDLSIDVTDIRDTNEAPVITSPASAAVAENTLATGITPAATDADGDTVTFALSGTDAALFEIVAGEIRFIAAPDFEAPGDAGADNTYELVLEASDGTDTTTQDLSIDVTDIRDTNEAPVITSPASAAVAENTLATGITPAATDADGDTVTFALSGTDAALFEIVAGEIRFIAAPDFEAPGDAGADNTYELVLEASDGTDTTTQDLSIDVTDIRDTNEAPVITSPASAAVAENTLATGITPAATDADGDTVTFALSGTDAALFEIVAGEIRFIAAPDFEAPGDAGADNTYELVLEASDGTDTTTQDLSIDVTDIRDTNEAPVITSPASAAVAENTLATGITPAATDADGDTVTFALSGTDAALFEIVAGEIRFIAAPDFEAPGDAGADNTYELVLEASDGTDTTTQDLSIDVTDIRDTNEAPVITSPASASLAENTLATGITPAATDADGDTVTFALSGTDAALFEIVAGEIRFIAAPDFEAPGDAGADNTYELVLEASDGTDTTTQDLSIDVTDIRDTNEAPVITSPASAAVAENTLATGITPAATDADGDTVTFALSGTDAALFEIVAGEIRFIAAPDFEAPGDAGADNTYELVLEASDGTDTTTQDLSIDVTDIRDTNEAPVITSPASAAVAENTLATGITPAATDADGDTVTFALSGTDAALFEIVAGEIRFIAAPDFEAPGDAGADNTYELVLEASDGTDTTTQDLSIDVTDIRDTNEAPVITSPASAAVAENTLATGITPAATDADGDTVTFALSGTDAALFEIVAGEIRFIAAPDFEAPGDAGADNTYELVLEASDGTDTTTQDLSIDVTDIRDTNEAPVITSPASASLAENTLATGITPAATDADGDTVTFALSGTDAALFEIVAGEIRFIAAPDFEAPGDAGADNTYELVLEASDGTDTTTQDLSIDVTDIRDTNEAPVITSPASASLAENTLATGITPAATDADGDTVTFALSGTDAALFEIVAGEIRFIAAPDFEAPGDAGADNTYELVLEASDGTDTTTQDLSIDVTDIRDTNEAPVITSPASAAVAENTLATGITPAATDADGDTVTFALSGTDAALFEIVAGEIRFIAAPDFEAPGDAGADNTYELVLEASDGTDTTTQDLSIDVTDIRDTNEAPVITSPASAAVAENTLATGITPAATDADGDTVTFALSGTDAALFEIVAGEIRFIAAPDFEAPGDAGADNTYELVLEASDGTDTTTQDLSIDVTDIRDTNEAPVITSPASASLAENTLATGITPAATDADGDTVTFALSGTDAALFEIVAGEIRFIAAPDFEAPGDAGADNTYELVLEASDGTDTTTQDLSIDVTDIRDTNEAPVITSPASAAVAENTLATGITPAATDADGDTVTFALSGTDAALFEIVAGEIRFIAAPDFEAPGDAGADNTYELVLEASDGTATSTATVEIAVQNVAEPCDGFNEVPGTPDDDILEATLENDCFETGAGQDQIIGSLDTLDGDVITDFSAADQLIIEGPRIVPDQVQLAQDLAVFTLPNGAETVSFTFLGDFSGQAFEVTSDGTDTTIALAGAGASQLSATGERFITTDGGENRVYGDLGDDVILSAGGADILSGGAGDDTLLGGNDDDILLGGLGNDTMTGGAGRDIFAIDASDFSAGFNSNFITDFTPGEDILELTGFGFNDFSDLSQQNVGDGVLIFLGSGLISLNGLSLGDLGAGDVSFGDAGRSYGLVSTTVVHRLTEEADRFLTTDPAANEVRAGGGDDVVIGAGGADVIYGEAGGDVLLGGAGADILQGGAGFDTLTGGADADQFVFEADEETVFGLDVITDFTVGEDVVVATGFGLNATSFDDFTVTTGGLTAQLAHNQIVVFQGITEVSELGDLTQVFDFG